MFLHLHDTRYARSQGTDGLLVVALEDDSRMAEPFEVLNDEVSAILLLVVALLRDHVSQHVLGHHATDDDTFDHFASSSRFSKLLLAKLICSEL